MLKERLLVSLADVDPLHGHILAAKFVGVPGVWGVELDLMRLPTTLYPSIGSMNGLGHGVLVRAPVIECPDRILRLCGELLESGAGAVSIPMPTSELFLDDEGKEELEALKSLKDSRWLHVEFDAEGRGEDGEPADDDCDPLLAQLPTGHTRGMRAVCTDADFAIVVLRRLRDVVVKVNERIGTKQGESLVIGMCVRLPVTEVLERLDELWAEPELEIVAVLPSDPYAAMDLADRLAEALRDKVKRQRVVSADEAGGKAVVAVSA